MNGANASELSPIYHSELRIRPLVAVTPRGHLLLLMGFYAYLLVVACLALYNQVPASEWVVPALLVYVAIRLAPIIIYKPNYSWFHPLTFGALLAFVDLLRAFSSYAWGLDSHVALPNYSSTEISQLLAYELLLLSLGLLAYYVGFFCLPTRPVARRLSFGPPRNLAPKAMFVVLFSFLVWALYIRGKGGVTAHLLSWARTRQVALAGDYYWMLFISLGAHACLIWFALVPTVLRSPIFWLCAAISGGVIFLANGSRSGIVHLMIIGSIVLALRVRKIPSLKLSITVLAALLLMGALGDLRRSTWTGKVDWSTVTQVRPLQAISKTLTGELVDRRTSGSGTLPILARVPSEIDLLYGDSYLAAVTLMVPKKLWPGKPGLVGGRVGATFFNIRAGVPAGPVGEGYWNFHIPGVLLAYFLFGLFHSWLVRWFDMYSTAPPALLLYAITLYMANPSSPGIVDWLLVFIPTFVLLRLFGAVSFLPASKKTRDTS